jgi:hypothetical protein
MRAVAAPCKDDPWCKHGFAGASVAPAVARGYREAKDGPLHDEDPPRGHRARVRGGGRAGVRYCMWYVALR